MIIRKSGQDKSKTFETGCRKKNKNEAKLKFQGQSARSQRLFELDFDWIEVTFITCEPDFQVKRFLGHDDTQDTNTFKIFQVPIRNSKCVEKLSFIMMPKCSIIVRSC